MASFVVSPAARQDLIDIWEYIAEDSINSADTVIHTIQDKFNLLSQQPSIGHRRTDLTNRPVLFWPVYNYLIVYKNGSAPLEIVRVLSGYRNLIEILGATG
jgi:plasmid stabilization system protein ParE